MKIILKKSIWFTTIMILCLGIVTSISVGGCDKPGTPSEKEYIDPTLLVGEWDCIKFAYITEDKVISNISILSKGHIIIANIEDKWTFVHTNEIFYEHLLSGNLIKLTMSGSTFVIPPQEELDICEALENAYSLSIKDNELMIYFKGVENKNLLILKKR